MSDGRLELALPVPRRAWGDREAPWAPDTVGRPARAAEAAWKIDPYPDFPDSVLDEGRVGDLDVLACAVRGSKHRFEGASRQDSAIACAAGPWALAAVADGVGSVPDSHLASAAAVRTVAAELARRLEQPEADPAALGRAVFREVNRALEGLDGPRTTLTAAAVRTRPDAEGNYPFWVAAVGDSPAYAIAGDELAPLFATEREDEFATTTAALPSAEVKSSYRYRTGRLRPGQALMLASDGLGDLMIAEELRAYFAGRWRSAPSAADFMRHVQVRRKSFDDDRSAAVLWALPGSELTRAPRLLPGVAERVGSTAVNDVEIRAARIRDMEVRAVSRRGGEASSSARPRQARLRLAHLHDRLVAVTAAPRPGTASIAAERWARKLLEIAEQWVPDASEEQWITGVWKGAWQSSGADFDLTELASAMVVAYPDHEGRVYYTAGVQGPVSAAKFGAGMHRELAEGPVPGVEIADMAGGPLHVYSGQLENDQALLLGSGVDPARLAEELRQPGPLQMFGALERAAGADDQTAVVLWGER